MKGLHRAALCGTALWAVLAAAADAPERRSAPALVPHPLVVVGGGEEDAVRFGPQLEAALARRDIHVVGQQCAREFVARRPAGSCGGEEACLAELARSCGGQRALYVTVYPYRPQMVFVGKVVGADGRLERSVSNVEVKRPKGRLRPETIRPGIETVLTQGLHLETLDQEPLVASHAASPGPEGGEVAGVQPAGAASPPPSAVTAPASARGDSAQRIVAYACLGTGVVALGVGTALLFGARSDEDAYRKTLDPDGQRPPTAQAQAAQASLRDKGAPVTVALVAGAALVVAGVTLWALDSKEPERTHVDVRGSAGGGSVVLAGKF
jgi:hypothetical protein